MTIRQLLHLPTETIYRLRSPLCYHVFLLVGCCFVFSFNTQAENRPGEPIRQDWIFGPPLDYSPYCNCDGYYRPSPLIDLGLNSRSSEAIYAASDQYEYNAKGVATLAGDTVLQKGPLQLQAEELVVDRNAQQATAKGAVIIRGEDFLMSGDAAAVDLSKDIVTLTNADFLFHENHLRGSAGSLVNKNGDYLTLEHGSYTSCPPEKTDWEIRGSQLHIDRKSGWGSAKHLRLHFFSVPIFYSPYLKFPIDDRRQTGLLFPTLDVSEPDIAEPFYWNIAPNYDATITPRYIGKRGDMMDVQFRYLNILGLGEFNGGFLDSDEANDYEDRKLFNWKQTSYWGDNWRAQADTTYVSDNDYFNDLGSDLSVNSQSHLDRKASVTYENLTSQVSVTVQAYQTIDDAIPAANRPYRRLPEIRWGYRNNLSDWLTWQHQLEHVTFEQKEKSNFSEAQRLYWNNTLSNRWDNAWGYVEPAWQWHYVQYQLEANDIPTGQQKHPSLSVPRAWLDTGIFLERLVNFADQQHLQTLEPRLFMLWTPRRDHDQIPLFDSSEQTFNYYQLFRSDRFSGGDRFGDHQQITAALTSRFINQSDGNEWLIMQMGQAFYLKDREVGLQGPIQEDSETSPIAANVTVNWQDHMRASVNGEWDSANNLFRSGGSSVQLLQTDRFSRVNSIFNLAYRYRAKPITGERLDQGEFSFIQSLSPQWDVIGRWLYDINNQRTLEQLSGLTYDSCCWAISLIYQRRVNDVKVDVNTLETAELENRYSFLVQLELKGLAGLGGTLSSVLSKGIKGYEAFYGEPL